MFIWWSWKYPEAACQGFSSFLENLAWRRTWMHSNCRRGMVPAHWACWWLPYQLTAQEVKGQWLLWCPWVDTEQVALSLVQTFPGIGPSLLMFLCMPHPNDWMWHIEWSRGHSGQAIANCLCSQKLRVHRQIHTLLEGKQVQRQVVVVIIHGYFFLIILANDYEFI